MKSSQSKKTLQSEKSKKKIQQDNTNQEEEKSSLNDLPKEKILERFIYITTYRDSDFLEKIKTLFEEINQKAFNLASPKEIYTQELTEEEKQNTDIDYISGFQILDNKKRITIIEGISGKGLQKVKDTLPKNQMNNETKMIFADSNILFDKRIYSKFNLSLKYIKTRDSLDQILTTFDIYLKSSNYREIYDAFMKIGSILKSQTLKDINDEQLFPDADSLLLLERKYGDILKEEDLNGIKKEKIIKKKYLITHKNFNTSSNEYNKTTKLLFDSNDDNNKSYINGKNPIFKKLVKNAINISLNNNNSKENNDLSFSNKYDSQINMIEMLPKQNLITVMIKKC